MGLPFQFIISVTMMQGCFSYFLNCRSTFGKTMSDIEIEQFYLTEYFQKTFHLLLFYFLNRSEEREISYTRATSSRTSRGIAKPRLWRSSQGQMDWAPETRVAASPSPAEQIWHIVTKSTHIHEPHPSSTHSA